MDISTIDIGDKVELLNWPYGIAIVTAFGSDEEGATTYGLGFPDGAQRWRRSEDIRMTHKATYQYAPQRLYRAGDLVEEIATAHHLIILREISPGRYSAFDQTLLHQNCFLEQDLCLIHAAAHPVPEVPAEITTEESDDDLPL